MSYKLFYLTIAALLCLSSALTVHAQSTEREAQTKTTISKSKGAVVTPEEKLIRDVYEKVSKLNRVAPVPGNRERTEESVIRFELSDFRIGPLTDITSTEVSKLVSHSEGEMVLLTRVTTQTNDGPEYSSYRAEWTAGQYASMYEPQWTIANLLSFEADKDYDVGEYAAYTVRVLLQGKSREYKAMAIFHNPYKFQGSLKPTFWDAVVGVGGRLNDVMNDNRPLRDPETDRPVLTLERNPTSQSISSEIFNDSLALAALGSNDAADNLFFGATSSGPLVRSSVQDTKEHRTGAHGQSVGMQGACFEEANNQQRCQVQITDSFVFENGELSNALFVHSNITDQKVQNATGSRNLKIDCLAAQGIATSDCLFAGCNFAASLQGTGVSLHMTGGDVWRDQIILTHSCNVSTTAGGSCTTPSFNGSCPIGSTPNGSGFCCFTGTIACSTDLANRCYRFGGDYDFDFCTCSGCDTCGGSPIIIDVDGDGIALTGPADGVDFDLNGNGTRDRLGWTLANSDDSWLALDRNGNGNIDSGAELFGDFTNQPAGPNKNGFLALAEFDKPANGGNGDGLITREDGVFTELRLWQDSNHNGNVDEGELHTLTSRNVKALELDFKESKRVDQFGNQFRYRGKVKDTNDGSIGRWAFDVFLSH